MVLYQLSDIIDSDTNYSNQGMVENILGNKVWQQYTHSQKRLYAHRQQ